MALPGMERAAAHPQAPTAKWAKFMAEIQAHATRAVGVREHALREQRDDTEYHLLAEGQTGG